LHRPLRGHRHNFIDSVSGETVYDAKCSCGKEYMVDSPFGWFGTKVEKDTTAPAPGQEGGE
jgi:hypothetical protein